MTFCGYVVLSFTGFACRIAYTVMMIMMRRRRIMMRMMMIMIR
jgi:hypothetical protein